MQSLFGHLCSGGEFSHDQEMREAIEIGTRSRKRARLANSSSRTSTQESRVTRSDDSSAAQDREHARNKLTIASNDVSSDNQPRPFPQAKRRYSQIAIASSSPPLDMEKDNTEDEAHSPSTQSRIWSIRNCLEGMKDEMLFINGNLSTPRETGGDNDEPSIIGADGQLSLPDSAFDSQEEGLAASADTLAADEQTPLTQDTSDADHTTDVRSNGLSIRTRKAAYMAARSRTYDAWSQVALLSAGNNHTEKEIEL